MSERLDIEKCQQPIDVNNRWGAGVHTEMFDCPIREKSVAIRVSYSLSGKPFSAVCLAAQRCPQSLKPH
jgi:hypothetical protein